MKIKSPYSAAITGGGFLFEETEALLPMLMSPNADSLLADERIHNNYLHINAETSRKKAIIEIRRRYNAVPISFWHEYLKMSKEDKTDRLQFYVLPLMEYHLSEELYMKMNARGLELTQFDNFKAEFCSAMKGQCDTMVPLEGGLQGEKVTQEENISIKLDAKWIDLFWDPKKPDSDVSYMRFFSRFFATRYMVDFNIPAKDLEKDSRLGAIYTKTEGQKGDIGFDAYKWVLENKPEEFTDSYFSAVEKVLDTLFDNKDIIANCLYPSWSEERQGNFMVDASVTFNQSYLVVFGAICES